VDTSPTNLVVDEVSATNEERCTPAEVVRPLLGIVSLAAFLTSLCLPAFEEFNGFGCVLMPLLAPSLLVEMPWWWANVLFAWGFWCLANKKAVAAGCFGFAAAGLALSCWFKFKGELRAGYWVWLSAMGVLALAPLVVRKRQGRVSPAGTGCPTGSRGGSHPPALSCRGRGTGSWDS
jgi:hypothetical protein